MESKSGLPQFKQLKDDLELKSYFNDSINQFELLFTVNNFSFDENNPNDPVLLEKMKSFLKTHKPISLEKYLAQQKLIISETLKKKHFLKIAQYNSLVEKINSLEDTDDLESFEAMKVLIENIKHSFDEVKSEEFKNHINVEVVEKDMLISSITDAKNQLLQFSLLDENDFLADYNPDQLLTFEEYLKSHNQILSDDTKSHFASSILIKQYDSWVRKLK